MGLQSSSIGARLDLIGITQLRPTRHDGWRLCSPGGTRAAGAAHCADGAFGAVHAGADDPHQRTDQGRLWR